MHKAIAAFLSAALSVALPAGPIAAHEPVNAEYLVHEQTSKLANDWDHTISIYKSEDGKVWGDGAASDPSSVGADGIPTRWLSYTFYDGDFEFVGSDDGEPVRASFGPDDVLPLQIRGLSPCGT